MHVYARIVGLEFLSTLAHSAMKRFLASAASSSSGRAERPATSTAPSSLDRGELSSAERPATSGHLRITSIRDVQRWLAEERVASCTSADAQRIREAVPVLSRPTPRQEDVQPLQSKWQVAQRQDKKPRPLPEVIQEFRNKIIKAAQKLQQQLADSTESSAERPATSGHLRITSIRDVQRWLAEERVASCTSADAQRIREAVPVLSRPTPRQEDVQPLQSKWQVAQRQDKKPRPLPEVIQEFRNKIIKAAQKLQQQLADSTEQPALPVSYTDLTLPTILIV